MTNTKTQTMLEVDMTKQELEYNAIRLARRIPLGKHTPEKCEAVHAWVKAVKDMLKGNV